MSHSPSPNSNSNSGYDSKEDDYIFDGGSGSTMNQCFANVEELNDAFDAIGRLTRNCTSIQVPRIVVIGDQSSGKSSLLESISGVDLPRGPGICTRVPLIAQLRKQKDGQPTEIWIEAVDEHGTVFKEQIQDEDAISAKIVEYTNKLVGENKSVKDLPITLSIKKQGFVNLTLIDLPGIVHNDKDRSKMRDIDNMVQKYIEKKETVILNVVVATQEAANVTSLNVSAKYDPEHERTLVVLTQIDQTTDGEGLAGKFEKYHSEEDFPAGTVFLTRNRSKKENDTGANLEDVHRMEEEFFATRKDMQRIPVACKGSRELSKKLAEMQTQRMLEILPSLKEKIRDTLLELELEKTQLPSICVTEHECRSRLSIIISQLFLQLNDSIHGTLNENLFNSKNGSPRKYLCSEVADIRRKYAIRISELRTTSVFLSDAFLKRLKEASDITRGGLSLPEELQPSIAVYIIRQELQAMQPICLAFLEEMCQCIRKTVIHKINDLCGEYNVLRRQLKIAFDAIIFGQKEITWNFLLDALDSETRVFFTNNQNYSATIREITSENGNGNVVKNRNNNNNNAATDDELIRHGMLRAEAIKIAAYWKTVCKSFTDCTVKMSQLYMIVKPCSEKMQAIVFERLCKLKVQDLLSVNPYLESKIRRNEDLIKDIAKAQNIFNDIYIKF